MKSTLNRCFRFIYRKLPFPEKYRMKMKNYYTMHFSYLTADISYQDWKIMNLDENQLQVKNDLNKYTADLFLRASSKSEEYVEKSSVPVSLSENDVKLIAFYLPQFHPFEENDHWWGKGFTEWTNVTKAVPQFCGHYQPHLPDELGFYDLRLIETQKQQIELAKAYGIYGFCYYYYWFSGKLLMERPLQQILEHPELDFPFCLCWANENWARRWDGMDNDVLIKQEYAEGDDLSFIKSIEQILCDKRYIRINNKPVVLIYRIGLLPDPKATTACWRSYCQKCGIGEICILIVQGHDFIDPSECGCDAAVEFPPHTITCPNITGGIEKSNPEYDGIVYNLKSFVASKLYLKEQKRFKLFKSVMPSWDNTARKPNNGVVFLGSSPSLYKKWLKDVLLYTRACLGKEEQFTFINAWNEWAEGAHLEPDRKYGYAYLQATKEALIESRNIYYTKKIVCVGHDAHKNGAQILLLQILKNLKLRFKYEIHLLLKAGGPLEAEYRKYAEVYNLEDRYHTNEKIEQLLSEIRGQGVGIALTNTVITGDLVCLLKKYEMEVISLVHELPGVIRQYHAEPYARCIAQYADKIVFPSSFVKDKFFTNFSLDETNKAEIYPQGLYYAKLLYADKATNSAELRQYLNIDASTKIVLGVGFGDHRKGIDLFLDVAMQVISQRSDVFFVWVGSIASAMRKIVDGKVKMLSNASQVVFVDFQHDLEKFYAGADLYVMTSREDPFPSVVLDAMAARTPVIGFEDAGGFSDIVTEDTGCLVPYGDTAAMGKSILTLLDQQDVIEKLGDSSRGLITEKYQFIDYIYKLLEFMHHNYQKVSVVVPNYNYEKYIGKRLQNIMDQTYPVYDMIILDDHSQDCSQEIIQEFQEKHKDFTEVYFNEQNAGCVFKQWAKGLAKAKGTLIWIAEADDFADCRFLEEVVQPFIHKDVVLSYCQSKQVDGEHRILAENYLSYTDNICKEKWKKDYIADGKSEICKTLAIQNTIPNVSGVVFRKEDINEILEDLVQYKNAGDWFFYVWLLSKGSIAYNATALNYHCRHEKSVTLNKANKDNLYHEILAMQDWIQQHYEVSDLTQEKMKCYVKYVKNFLEI